MTNEILDREQQTFQTAPSFEKRFRSNKAKEIVGKTLQAKLTGVVYHPDNTSTWAKDIADEIKLRIKEQGWDRYKYVSQVIIGEQRGEGIKVGSRCFWDANTDGYAQEIFTNETIFCIAAVFATYIY